MGWGMPCRLLSRTAKLKPRCWYGLLLKNCPALALNYCSRLHTPSPPASAPPPILPLDWWLLLPAPPTVTAGQLQRTPQLTMVAYASWLDPPSLPTHTPV